MVCITIFFFIVGCWGTRHTLTFMSFLGIAVNYCMRVNMSVAIVAMVKPRKFSTIKSMYEYEKTFQIESFFDSDHF